MQTAQLRADSPADIQRAAALLRAGELVAMPTETVYGLAANALDPAAVARIFAAKGRPQDNPLIVHAACTGDILPLVTKFPVHAQTLARAFWPGPLTMILPRAARVPEIVSAGLPTVALRVPAHPAAQALLRACALPLAAPSANRSGRPSATCAAHALSDFDGLIPAVLDGGACAVGVESTVVSLVGTPVLLRPGGILHAQLEGVLGCAVGVSPAVTRPLEAGEPVSSPGMKYRHYAPRARLTLVRGGLDEFMQYTQKIAADGVLCFDEDLPLAQKYFQALSYGPRLNYADQACQLFARLRQLDDRGLQNVCVRCPDKKNLAVYNRLLRAAAFREVDADGA